MDVSDLNCIWPEYLHISEFCSENFNWSALEIKPQGPVPTLDLNL